ncbi:MAG: hypothetical protein O6761_06190, partial [Thaumarchaeota archaeon]|nr:hypothetical protein [Nitrososphaerota archaeon]
MDKKLRYLGLLAILPLFTFAITSNYIIDADALKSKGVGTKQFGSATKRIVCGDRLCSEPISQPEPAPVTTVPEEPEEEEPMMVEEEMEEEKPMMVEEEMEEVAPGSVLRLSRANVPAIIPMHQGYYNGEPVYFIVT